MTPTEYAEWFDYHCELFPSTADWAAKNAKTIRHWPDALAKVPLDSAKEISKLMMTGDVEAPRFPSDTPKYLRTASWERFGRGSTERPQPRLIDGQWVVSCRECEDTGLVTCWHPAAMRAAQQSGKLDRVQRITIARPCKCRAGDWYERRGERYELAKDGPRPECNLPTDDDVDELMAWLQGKAGTRANALDEWNQEVEF